VDPQDVLAIQQKHGEARSELVAILSEIQAKYGYLPVEALRIVADRMRCSLVDIYGVATFYASLSLKPRGKHHVCVCLGTACHVRGAAGVAEEFERQLKIRAGETTADREFTLETVNCLGACALGPVAVVDGQYFSKVARSRVRDFIRGALIGPDKVEVTQDKRLFPIKVSCPVCNQSLMERRVTVDGHPSISVAISFGSRRGRLALSSVYGSYNIVSKHDISAGTVVKFSCPHCQARLAGSWDCPICGAPMVSMKVRWAGMVHICSRRGCKNHMLDLE
jgi:NADH-quinone oxidoreductase subunit E